MAAPRLTGATRAEHLLLHNLCAAHGVRLSPSGHALIYGARGRASGRSPLTGVLGRTKQCCVTRHDMP
jgi:hypothetical protein